MNAAQTVRSAPPLDFFGIRISSKLAAVALPLSLFLAAFVVLWQYDPLHRSIYQDPGIFAYLSQLVAQGLAPHKYGFNEQASLTFLLGGAAMRLGSFLDIHPLLSLRGASMLVMACAVVLTYRVSALFTRSRAVGFLAGIIMLGYEGYNVRAATTLEPKALMLVLGLATLYFLYRHKWFLAGACAGAAGLAWQIAWGYLVIALLLAAIQGGSSLRARARAAGLTLLAALVVFAIYTLYFVSNNALLEMLQQTFLAPVLMHEVTSKPLDARLLKLAKTFYLGFGTHAVFGVLGASGLLVWLGANTRPWELSAILRRASYFLFQNRRTAGTLLVVAGFVVYSLLDFQNYPDWFPLLPFFSMFAAWLGWTVCQRVLERANASPAVRRAVLVGLGCLVLGLSTFHVFAHTGRDQGLQRGTWQEQQRVADEISAKLAPEAHIWLLGKAELLFFMGRTNVNKYIYLFGNVDAAAEAFEPGGFRQMVNEALAQKPVLFTLARATPQKFASRDNSKFMEHATKNFTKLQRCRTLGGGRFFVRPEKANALFPKGAEGCLKR